MLMHQLAPSGTPVSFGDIVRGIHGQLIGRVSMEDFRLAICRHFGVRHCFFVSTGRAAFALILQALREIGPRERDEVVVPSYTCYSVPASVARAGLKVRVCDIDPATLDYDYASLERADFSRVLCVASANLYGIPNDIPRLRAIAARQGTFLLDDAAQSMNARVDGMYSGTMGDVGFFSLDKGKNITTIDGGIIVTDRCDIGSLLACKVAGLKQPSLAVGVKYLTKLIIYSAFLRPWLYWIPERLPFLKLGTTPYPHDVPIEGYAGILAGIGQQLFERMESLNAERIAKATYAIGKLREVDAVQVVTVTSRQTPVYLRLPLLVRGTWRDRAISALKQQGIGATGSFPTSVVDIPGIDPALFRGPTDVTGGRRVAKHILTLPTHAYVPYEALDRASCILAECSS